ncbi:MAG: PRC and DUF2382 domain-containing protein [Myxococcales bacterium]
MLGALSRLPSWELDRNEEDVRGWPLRDDVGNLLGTVDELIVDTDTQYVTQVVLTDGRKFPAHDVFIGDGIVTLGNITRQTAPRTVAAPPSPRAVAAPPQPQPRQAPAPAPVATAPVATAPRAVRTAEIVPTRRIDEADLIIPIVDEELEVGKRVVESGGVRVQSHMAERPVEKSVRLRDERVTVERRPIDRPLTAAEADARFRDGSFEMKALSEVPIVGKRAHVVEEIFITKNITERTEKVRDTLRHTEAEVTELPSRLHTRDRT